MQNKLDNFIREHKGETVTAQGGYGGQCVDLAVLWFEANDLKRVWANAKDWAQHGDNITPFMSWKGESKPQVGDLIIWGKTWGRGYGHLAIFMAGTKNNFRSLEQNNPVGANVRIKTHNSAGITGFLRVNDKATTPPKAKKKRKFVRLKQGESVWYHANKRGLSTDKLLKINNITNPTKLPVGYKLYLS